MIELKNINKYYYRHKKNEVHVINNTSLKFPNKGLIALLGESGSGKTTLLNVIGGLDKFNKGKLFIDGKKITKRNVDKIRNLNIGYVFQDYKLLDDMSVFDNVAISLKLCGLKDKAEIKERVDSVLKVLKLYRYRKRNVLMLSGGERQRVGIARAIVKNPNIIICDEPTGNLDSRNSVEIMNIIKSLSKEKLVILVTHEEELANFYAERIIRIVDGEVISDEENTPSTNLEYIIDDKIYLKDFEYNKQFKINDSIINFYGDSNDLDNLDIIYKNGSLYINTNKKTELISNTNIELIDDHESKMDKSIYEKYEYKTKDFKKKNSHIFKLSKCFRNGLNVILNYSLVKKLLLVAYITLTAMIMYAVSSLGSLLFIYDESNYSVGSKNLVEVYHKVEGLTADELSVVGKTNHYKNIKNMEHVNEMFPIIDKHLYFYFDNFYQIGDYQEIIIHNQELLNNISRDDLIFGRMPENKYEVVIDRMLYDNLKKDTEDASLSAGVHELKDILNTKLSFVEEDPNSLKLTIVGIVDKKTANYYISEEDYLYVLTEDIKDAINYYNRFKDSIKIVRGREPINDNEVIINENDAYYYPINSLLPKDYCLINNKQLKVVGYYKPIDDNNMLYDLFANTNTYREYAFEHSFYFKVYSDDIEALKKEAEEKDYVVKNINENRKEEYLYNKKAKIKNVITVASIIFVIVFLIIFITTRSAFLSRVKEVGLLRAIGVNKNDVCSLFISEGIVATTIGNIIGSVFMYGLLNVLIKVNPGEYYISWLLFPISWILAYAIVIMIVIIPLRLVLRKYPAQILSRKDI